MACEAPIRAYAAATGGRIRMYTKKDWQYHVEPYTGLAVPCGTCILCQQEKARQQAVRIAHEAQLHEENSFVTLTYRQDAEPPNGSLRYEDLEKFLKRLRIALWRKKGTRLRYYAVGEYGDKTHRPHFHACMFGESFTQDRIILREQPTFLWTNPMLEQAWGLGYVSVGDLNFTTANYTTSYVMKKLTRKQQYVNVDEETGELIRLAQPKAYMSRHPGLAAGWLEKYGSAVYDHDHVVIDGRPQKPPRSYDKWLARIDPERSKKIKDQRMKALEPEEPEKTRARARNAHARAKNRSKSI